MVKFATACIYLQWSATRFHNEMLTGPVQPSSSNPPKCIKQFDITLLKISEASKLAYLPLPYENARTGRPS